MNNRRVVLIKLDEVNPAPDSLRLVLAISRYRNITLCPDTITLTETGEQRISQKIRRFTGYCQENPKNLVERDVDALVETKDMIATVELRWHGPEYIWAEGILVGGPC